MTAVEGNRQDSKGCRYHITFFIYTERAEPRKACRALTSLVVFPRKPPHTPLASWGSEPKQQMRHTSACWKVDDTQWRRTGHQHHPSWLTGGTPHSATTSGVSGLFPSSHKGGRSNKGARRPPTFGTENIGHRLLPAHQRGVDWNEVHHEMRRHQSFAPT